MKRYIAIAAMCCAWLCSEQANAALVCSNVSGGGYLTEVQAWQVGQTKPQFATPIDELVCAADGPERLYIQDRFSGLPMRTRGTSAVIWRGRDAQFIVDNL